jgi:hypothetical protein
MLTHTVFIEALEWTRKGHGGASQETDYTVFINECPLRMFSTHGNMHEGYWGSNAKEAAESYAHNVAEAIGCEVKHIKNGEMR